MLVRGLSPVTVVIAEPDPAWPTLYEGYAAILRSVLGDRLLLIEHIGSTSVPGLAAKPVIDITAGIVDPDDEAAYLADLVTAGWDLRVNQPGHRCLRAEPADQRPEGRPALPANLHCYCPTSPDRQVPTSAGPAPGRPRRPGQIRRPETVAPNRDWPDMNLYADAKGPLIRELLGEASED